MIEKEIRAYSGPGKYIQGKGVLNRFPEFTSCYGKKLYFVIDVFFYDRFCVKFKELYADRADTELSFEKFEGEITLKKVERSADRIGSANADTVIGIGGGKCLDLAKGAAFKAESPSLIVVPTTASNDAPCSADAVLYEEDGAEIGPLHLRSNPDLVFVDTAIIAKAPVRFLRAGMGDALATYYEAMANEARNRANYVRIGNTEGYKRTTLGLAAAKSCADVIFRDGVKAMKAAESGAINLALENVIEANVLLSGIGFENTACAGAHAVSVGLSGIKSAAPILHGEKVAYGILVQLHVENATDEEIEKVMEFYTRIGLPLTLEDLGVADDDETLRRIAEHSFPTEWAAEPGPMDADIVADALKITNAYGNAYKRRFFQSWAAVVDQHRN